MKIIITAILVTIHLSGYAQYVIKPGDKVIRSEWLKPSHEYYKNVATDTAGKIMWQFMMEDVTTIDSVNKRVIFARFRQIPFGDFSVDTSVTDLSFRPISMHEIHIQRNASFEMTFGDTLASVTTDRKGVISVKNYPMKSGYFEDNMIGYIVGCLDLKKGITYTMDNFNKDTQSPSDPYTVEYAFDDVWDLPGSHQLHCRVFHFTHGRSTGYMWIDKETNVLIKQEGTFKGGGYLLTRQ
jgi:hypothetical protein